MGTMKKAKLELCMFCGHDRTHGKMSREHFVPKGLWAGPRPNRTVTLPAHVACNNRFAADNEYFRNALASHHTADAHPEAKRLLEGKIRRELEKNPAKARKFFKNIRMVNVQTPSGLYLGQAPAFEVDPMRMERVLKNIVRGVFYVHRGYPLPPDVPLKVNPGDEHILSMAAPLIDKMPPKWRHFGDDVFACRYLIDARFKTFIACLMVFYRRISYFGLSMPPELAEERRNASPPPTGRILVASDDRTPPA